MRVTALEIKARLENVTDLTIGENYQFFMKFRCTHCRTKTKKAMSFTTEASVPVVGGRGHVNLAFKCKECTRVSTITVLSASLRPYTAQDGGTFQRFIELDCRGCSPTKFRPLGQFTCTNTQGDRQFASVDLTKSQWIDRTYEETVGVHEFTYQFKVYRK